jgi:VanZ family protein
VKISKNSANRRGRFFRYAPLILWIGLVMLASMTQASMANTSRFIRPFLIFLFPDAPEAIIDIYHAYIRKSAHFIEYAILAFWAWRAFWNSSKEFLRKYWFAVSFLTVVSVASIDEYNQSLNLTRTGSIYDVLLDVSGGLAMILLLWLFTKKQSLSTVF